MEIKTPFDWLCAGFLLLAVSGFIIGVGRMISARVAITAYFLRACRWQKSSEPKQGDKVLIQTGLRREWVVATVARQYDSGQYDLSIQCANSRIHTTGFIQDMFPYEPAIAALLIKG